MKHLAYLLWRVWLSHLTPMFLGFGVGATQDQKNLAHAITSLGDFEVGKGKGLTDQASDFWSSIMSGDMEKIMKVLGPQISAIKGQGQQAKQTAAQFSNRSGGTNAFLQTVDDRTRGSIQNLVDSLTGTAASNITSMGMNLLNMGGENQKNAFNAATTIQELQAKKWGDIFNSISGIVGGIAGLPGVAGTTTGKVLTGVAGMIQ